MTVSEVVVGAEERDEERVTLLRASKDRRRWTDDEMTAD